MNSKIKKIISIFILIVIIVSSLTYYENSTEPQGLHGICNGSEAPNYSYAQSQSFLKNGHVGYLYSDNVSYLGNKAALMLWIYLPGDIYNMSQISNISNQGNGYQIVSTSLFISNESYAPLFSHIVISVTNFSIAFNKTMFYNETTNRGDSFGNAVSLFPNGGFNGNQNIYFDNLAEPRGCGPAFGRVIIPGNYTIYENITFTITVSLGILHFTSQEYSIHKSWWELWQYNDQKY